MSGGVSVEPAHRRYVRWLSSLVAALVLLGSHVLGGRGGKAWGTYALGRGEGRVVLQPPGGQDKTGW